MVDTPTALRDSLEAFKSSAGGPVPSDPWAMQHWEMAGAHATFLNALLAIYEQASAIPQQKQTNFVGFCLLWCAVLHSHHEFEEETYFALYAPKLDTAFVHEEHAAFQDGVTAFENYLVSCLPPAHPYGFDKTTPVDQTAVPFDGAKLCALIDSFAAALSLVSEVTHLEPAKLRAAGLTADEMQHIAAVGQAYVRKFPIARALTFAVLCAPRWTAFPPVPALLRHVLVPYVLAIPYRHFWEFAPKGS
ncbi:hypothetical protein PsYK624_132270 [Phanerochaete sordida]|uniref:Hemerythrin-like domain-containing protein n=1 Tax=Phanerochaete sordida TaxID=48140 RepID=A0A9P3LK92_9APHY|nr:hypothetical protein PsYK624_132270 [Phanerochaete sordida]